MSLTPPGPDGSAAPAGALPVGHTLPVGTVLACIGHGPTGYLYKVREGRTGRIGAVREFHPRGVASRVGTRTQALPALQERFDAAVKVFLEDANRLAGQDHPSLLQVEQAWQQDGTGWMLTPLYTGRTLADAVRDRATPVPQAEIERWLRALVDALAPLHRGIGLHGRISPSNVLILEDGLPVLMEMGRALQVLDPAMHPSPLDPPVALEQIPQAAAVESGAPATADAWPGGLPGPGPWTDVHALAATVRFVITGQQGIAACERRSVDRQEPLSRWAGGPYGSAFLMGIDRALAVDPRQRPATLAAFMEGVGLRDRRTRNRRDGASLLHNLPAAVTAVAPEDPAPSWLPDRQSSGAWHDRRAGSRPQGPASPADFADTEILPPDPPTPATPATASDPEEPAPPGQSESRRRRRPWWPWRR